MARAVLLRSLLSLLLLAAASCANLVGQMETDKLLQLSRQSITAEEEMEFLEHALTYSVKSHGLNSAKSLDIMIKMADNYYNWQSDADKAEELFKYILSLSSKMSPPISGFQFHCLFMLTKIMRSRWDYTAAKDFYRNALFLEKQLDEPAWLLELGYLYRIYDEDEKATEAFSRAVFVADRSNREEVGAVRTRESAQIFFKQNKALDALARLEGNWLLHYHAESPLSLENAEMLLELCMYRLTSIIQGTNNLRTSITVRRPVDFMFASGLPDHNSRLRHDEDSRNLLSKEVGGFSMDTDIELPLFDVLAFFAKRILREPGPDVGFKRAMELYAYLLFMQDAPKTLSKILDYLMNWYNDQMQNQGLSVSIGSLDNYIDSESQKFISLIYSAAGKYRNERSFIRTALAAAYLLKNRSAEEENALSWASYRQLDAEARKDFDELKKQRRRYANASTIPNFISKRPQQAIEAIDQHNAETRRDSEAEIRRLEKKLSDTTRSFRRLRYRPLDEAMAGLARAIPRDGALIEFISFPELKKTSCDGCPLVEWKYLAIVVDTDGGWQVSETISGAQVKSVVRRLLYEASNRQSELERVNALAAEAYQVIMAPIAPLVSGKSTLIIAPDGDLNVLPFELLRPAADSEPLIERVEIQYINTWRDLVREESDKPVQSGVVVFAEVNYEDPPLIPDSIRRQRARVRSDPHREWDLDDLRPLPATKEEAEEIERRLPKTRVYRDREASESALLALKAPGLLHIATHGLLQDESESDIALPEVGRGERSQVVQAGASDPLLRSGLFMAGAKSRLKGERGSADGNDDDGVATAMEISGMDLWGTELVVLSACKSGLGSIKPGQGVYGMRRAFFAAGAETLVMSLWKVPDRQTQQLMADYYRRLVVQRAPRISALRQAARALRRCYPHPYYWAAFIGLGKNQPLRGVLGSTPVPVQGKLPCQLQHERAAAAKTPATARHLPTCSAVCGGP